jgi:flagellar hook-length control protein FliK
MLWPRRSGACRVPSTAPDETATPSSLSQLLAGLGGDLRSSAPDLADKLDAIAAQLKSKSPAPDLLDSLGLTDDVAANIAKLVEAFKSQRSATKPAEPAPLATPVLPPASDLTGSSTTSTTKTDGTAVTTSTDAAPTQQQANVRLQQVDAPAADDKPKSDASSPASAADAAAQAQASQPASTSSVPQPARLAHAAYAAPVQQINIPQVAFEVFRQFQAGNSRFQIRLDPPELGRIDVKLDLDKHGTINARMVVERPETLDLMQRDQRALQQALNQAGLDAGKTNLEFSLRQSPFSHEQFAGQGQQGNGYGSTANAGTADETAEASAIAGTYYRGTATAGGVNLFV